jgi:hypothetical protein
MNTDPLIVENWMLATNARSSHGLVRDECDKEESTIEDSFEAACSK